MNLSQKDIVKTFLNQVTTGEAYEAFRDYVADDFKHHNPYYPGNGPAIMEGMADSYREFPNKTFEIKHLVEEGDMVVAHSFLKQAPDDEGMMVVHMFRFRQGKIVELWDIGQAIPENVVNENGLF